MKMVQREYLRSIMFGIENSLISTVGLIAGISLGSGGKRVVILGATVAIVIEAVAMGVGEYLSDDAVQDLDKLKRHVDNPVMSGTLMMASGTLAGILPLLPVIFLSYPTSLICSVTIALIVLYLLGYIKGRTLGTSTVKGGLKILVVGGAATLVGAIVGLVFKL